MIACSAFFGCAVGNKYRYDDLVVDVKVASRRTVAITTIDRRAAVVTGNKSPDFVGIQRAELGIPFDVYTASGAPLAADMTAALGRSFDIKGFHVTRILAEPRQAEPTVVARLQSSGAGRLVVLELHEWSTDTHYYSQLTFDVELRIYDHRGAMLATKRVSGKDQLGGDMYGGSVALAKRAARDAWVSTLESLFDAPAIQKALVSRPLKSKECATCR